MLTVRQLRWFFLAALAILFIAGLVSQPAEFGASQEWSNGKYRFAGGTAPWALLLSATILALYLLLASAERANLGPPLQGLVRRFFAFFVDFLLAMFMIGPILGIVPMLVEWRRTGLFRWTFERDTPAVGDSFLTIALVLLASVLLIIYYSVPLVRDRPSPGSCILGYQTIADEGERITTRRAVLRTLLGFMALCSWPLLLFMGRDRNMGKFWVDKVFRTRAVRVA